MGTILAYGPCSKVVYTICQAPRKLNVKGRKTEKISHLNAVRYSTSPIGGSTPPVQAMLTLKPTPGPTPTYRSTHKRGTVKRFEPFFLQDA